MENNIKFTNENDRNKPFIHGLNTIMGMNLDVIIALVPALVYGTIRFGFKALVIVLTAVATAELSEVLFNFFAHRKSTANDLSAITTGLVMGLVLPPTVPLWIPVVGSAFAIIVAKCVFGGIGKNLVNPAICARVFLVLSFPTFMSNYSETEDLVSSATALSSLKSGVTPKETLFNLAVGNVQGTIGGTCALVIVFGLIYLLIRRAIDWKIPLCYVGTVFLVALLFPQTGNASAAVYHLLSGGLLFGAVFCAGDPVTSPVTDAGKVIFGILLGVLTLVIRYFASYPDGVSFAIVLANLCVPLIDKLTVKRKAGGVV